MTVSAAHIKVMKKSVRQNTFSSMERLHVGDGYRQSDDKPNNRNDYHSGDDPRDDHPHLSPVHLGCANAAGIGFLFASASAV